MVVFRFLLLWGFESCFADNPQRGQRDRSGEIANNRSLAGCRSGNGNVRIGGVLDEAAHAHLFPIVVKMFAAIKADDVYLSMRLARLGNRAHRETCTPMPASDTQAKQNFPPV